MFILVAGTGKGEKLCEVWQERQDSEEEEVYLRVANGPFRLPRVVLGSWSLQQAQPGSKLHLALGPYSLMGYTCLLGITCYGRDKCLPHPQRNAKARRIVAHQPLRMEGIVGQCTDIQPLPHWLIGWHEQEKHWALASMGCLLACNYKKAPGEEKPSLRCLLKTQGWQVPC